MDSRGVKAAGMKPGGMKSGGAKPGDIKPGGIRPDTKRRWRRVTLRQLEIFESVARHGGVTQAAKSLHLTQPSVSIQLKSLADTIGRPLFETSGRGIRLTDVGRELAATCRELESAWAQFEARIEDHNELRGGHLSISVVTTAKYILPKALGLFCRKFPGIEVELDVQNRDGVIARMRDRLDEMHIMSAPPLDANLLAEPFLDNPLVVIAPRDYPRASRPYALSALAKERFLLREPGSGTRLAVDEHLAREGVALSSRMVIGSNEAIKQAVAGGLGLAIVSRSVLSTDDMKELIELPVRGFPIRRAWYIVRWRDHRLTPAAQAFLEFLTDYVKPLRDAAGRGSRRTGG
jgi:LysR family transcriptional regulator, low CO2-responsive transcriptional regulator